MREAVLDANILLRHLTDEPRPLADTAGALFGAVEEQHVSLLVAPLTVAEVVYVLESFYQWQRGAIVDGLLAFLSSAALAVLERDTVQQALAWYRDVPAIHFADAYVAALAVARGHGAVMSFDRGLRRVPGIRVIEQPAQLRWE